MFNLSKNIPQEITDLILAVKQAERDYVDTAEKYKAPELDSTLQELPDCLGQFLSHLDLQNEFVRLGIPIRSFENAARVMVALNTFIVNRVEADLSLETKKYIEKLYDICTEVGRIRAAFTVEKTIYPDDEDFLYDLTYSDN
jgi:hypothetical protein